MTDAPRKTRPPTSRATWIGAIVTFIVIGVVLYVGYVTVGAGRTVDASGVRPGMSGAEVSGILGDPDEYVHSGDETAMRYGRTHIWCKGMPGRGQVVTDITAGAR
jgi:hypothetical protein